MGKITALAAAMVAALMHERGVPNPEAKATSTKRRNRKSRARRKMAQESRRKNRR